MHRRVCAVFVLALGLPVGAAAAERMTDEQVKKHVQDIDAGFDTWKQSLEKRNLDDAVITSAERSIKVKDFLKDFEKSIDAVKDRFRPDYAATQEVLALLRLGSDVELRNRRQNLTPDSTWAALSAKLATLAHVYAVPWPIEDMNARPSRLNDSELATRVEQMEQAAKRLRDDAEKAAKANKAIDKPSRESLKGEIQQLEQMAKGVRSRIKDDMPASVEVGQLFSQVGKVRDTLTKLSLSSAEQASWRGLEPGIDALALAFDLPKP